MKSFLFTITFLGMIQLSAVAQEKHPANNMHKHHTAQHHMAGAHKNHYPRNGNSMEASHPMQQEAPASDNGNDMKMTNYHPKSAPESPNEHTYKGTAPETPNGIIYNK